MKRIGKALLISTTITLISGLVVFLCMDWFQYPALCCFGGSLWWVYLTIKTYFFLHKKEGCNLWGNS